MKTKSNSFEKIVSICPNFVESKNAKTPPTSGNSILDMTTCFTPLFFNIDENDYGFSDSGVEILSFSDSCSEISKL
jgi:hypothetical protein